MDGPSRHLTWEEMACKDGTPFPEHLKEVAFVLGEQFEHIRSELGMPIRVGSAYRTEAWNRKVGGARTSQHKWGTALDGHTPALIELGHFLDVVLEVARHYKIIRGIGLYPWGIHFDVRPTSRLYRWKGSRIAPELSRRLYA